MIKLNFYNKPNIDFITLFIITFVSILVISISVLVLKLRRFGR